MTAASLLPVQTDRTHDSTALTSRATEAVAEASPLIQQVIPRADFSWHAVCFDESRGSEARGDKVDMQVKPDGLKLSAMADPESTVAGINAAGIDPIRLDQLMRWHGTDEHNLPPAHTLQNLSRDTVAALEELQRARETIADLRAAMGRAFWATGFRDVHEILLTALGPPPDEADPPAS